MIELGTRTITASSVRRSTEDAAQSAADQQSTVKVENAGDAADKANNADGQNRQQHQTFAAMLRNSKFVQMGDPVGKVS